MARTLDLRKYQEDILVRIKDQTRAADANTRNRLGVRAGDRRLLVRLDDISEVLPVPEVHPVPLSRSWFLGMANVRGNLYGVSDLSQFAGGSATTIGVASRILLIHQKYKAHAGCWLAPSWACARSTRWRSVQTKPCPVTGSGDGCFTIRPGIPGRKSISRHYWHCPNS